jgi:hypothetical protein
MRRRVAANRDPGRDLAHTVEQVDAITDTRQAPIIPSTARDADTTAAK